MASKFLQSADIGALCVSHSVPKSCYRSESFQAGACDTLILSHATKLWIRVGRETWPVSCTCDVTVDHAVQFLFFCLHGCS